MGAGRDPLAVPADADVVQLRGHLVASGACRDTPQDHGLVFRGDESLDRVFRGEQLVERNRGELRQVTVAGENAPIVHDHRGDRERIDEGLQPGGGHRSPLRRTLAARHSACT